MVIFIYFIWDNYCLSYAKMQPAASEVVPSKKRCGVPMPSALLKMEVAGFWDLLHVKDQKSMNPVLFATEKKV